jgi:hypothetical protein
LSQRQNFSETRRGSEQFVNVRHLAHHSPHFKGSKRKISSVIDIQRQSESSANHTQQVNTDLPYHQINSSIYTSDSQAQITPLKLQIRNHYPQTQCHSYWPLAHWASDSVWVRHSHPTPSSHPEETYTLCVTRALLSTLTQTMPRCQW